MSTPIDPNLNMNRDESLRQVSIVMPSLNQAGFIVEAVRSVLAQPVDAELIVADGGSIDGSQAALSALAESFPSRLRWTSAPDFGPADAVNQAVLKAQSSLIGWLNSDDLYAVGAVARAVERLTRHPDQVMAYGHGEHIDENGHFIERYPTQAPTTPLEAFADGCFICQPTAFFRRDAFLALGGLDTNLKASFDFDLWLRMFKAYPGRIGFIDAVQAQSRLHAGGITARFRERVALEGIEVIRRHIGPPPAHWLLTHLEELCASQPFQPEALSLRERFHRVLDKAAKWLSPQTVSELLVRLEADPRVRLSDAQIYVGVHADGWASEVLEVRLQQGQVPVRAIHLSCRQLAPGGGGLLRMAISGPQGPLAPLRVDGNGEFEFTLDVTDTTPGARLVYHVRTEGGFVPAEVEPGSSDRRVLAFRVEGCTLLR